MADGLAYLWRPCLVQRSPPWPAQTIDVEIRALYEEARGAGLVPDEDIADRIVLVRTLQGARTARSAPPSAGDVDRQDRYVALERRARTLRADLQWVLDDRALLLDQRNEESDYEQSLQLQAGRLTSLDLIGFTSGNGTADVPACPACGQPTDEADPTPAALRSSLNRLRGQLENLAADRPSQRNALQALEAQATAFREGLASAEAALNALQGADRVTNLTAADPRPPTGAT